MAMQAGWPLQAGFRDGRWTEPQTAAATILARSPVKRLFDVSDVGEGRFVYHYHHAQLAYDETLAGHYVLATSLDSKTADAAEVLAAYRSLQHVEQRFRVLKSTLGLRPIRHFTENRVRGHIAICVLAAVAESLISNRLRAADLRDPDIEEQPLSADRALQELDRIRQVTFTAGEQTITAITRRTQLQQQILGALGVDTAPGAPAPHPRLTADPPSLSAASCGCRGQTRSTKPR
jgi:hypothetical protein